MKNGLYSTALHNELFLLQQQKMACTSMINGPSFNKNGLYFNKLDYGLYLK